jgi:hypothetical protein
MRTQPSTRRVPPALLPDGTLALLRYLRLPRRLRLRVLRELDVRRGSDRSGPRLPIRAEDWLHSLEAEP